MTSNVDHSTAPDSPLKGAEMAKVFHAQLSPMEEEMDSGQMRLEAMGYKQELRRKIGFWGAFSLIFSILSALLGPNTLYIIGLANGGPVVITWGWILVSVMTFIVAASMAEIGSAFPTAGGPYFWVHHLIPETHARWKPIACWLTGWLNLIGQIAGTASVTFSCSQLLTMMITMATGGANGLGWIPNRGQQVMITAGLYFIMAMWNTFRVEFQTAISVVSALWTAVVAVVIIIVLPLIAKQHQSATFVFTSFINNSSGVSGSAYVFLIGLLLPQFQLAGYDAVFHLAEETKNADYTSPVALLSALAASSVLGFLYLVSVTFCISDYDHLFDPDTVTGGAYPIAQIMWDAFEQRFNHGGDAVILLGFIVVAILLSASSLLTSNARMVYAFSRDGAIPGSFLWHRLDSHGTPVLAVWLSVGVGMCLVLPYVWSVTAYNSVVAISTVALYLAYGCPVFLRTFISRRNFLPGPFHLGRWSFWNGLISCLWVGLITVIFVVPTAYPVTGDNLNYAGITVGAWVTVVMTYYFVNASGWFTGPMTTLDVDIL